MNCLGTNITEVKDTIKQGIQSILHKNGGALNTNGTVELGNTQIQEVASYLKEAFGTSDRLIETSSWLVEKDGKIYYQFPTNVENWTKKAFDQKEKKERIEYETAMQLSTEKEVVESRTEEENLMSESRPEDLLFSPALCKYDSEEVTQIIKDNAPPIGTAPTDFKVWIDQKKALLDTLKRDFKHFKRSEPRGTDYYRNTVAEYEKTILSFEKNIKELEVLDISSEEIYADIIKEVELLKDVISKMGSVDIDPFKLGRRLDILSKLFWNRSLDGNSLDKTTADSNIFFVLKDDPVIKGISTDIQRLLDNYAEKMFDQISLILSDNELIKERERQGKMQFTDQDTGEVFTGEDATKKVLQLLEKTRVRGTDGVSLWALGSATGGGIIGQLARIVADTNAREGQAQAQEKQKIIQDNVTDFKRSGLTVDIFEQEDEFGVKNGFLVHKYAPTWFKYLANQRHDRKLFGKVSEDILRSSIYQKMMDKKKENERLLDFTKIQAIEDLLGNSPLYKEGFTSSSSEKTTYEKEMRDLLGDLFFEDLVEQQIKALEDFETFYINNYQDFSEEVDALNPLSFLHHFDSKNYNKAVKSEEDIESDQGGIYLFPDYVMSIPLDKRKNYKGEEISTGLYSENFKIIEQNESAFKIWQALSDLYQNIINPTLRDDGHNIGESGLELPKVDDYIQSVLYNNLNRRGKAIQYAADLYRRFVQMFTNVPASSNTKVRAKYSDTLKKKSRDMAKMLESETLEKLIETAYEEKILTFNKNNIGIKRYEKANNKTILDTAGIDLIQAEIARLKENIDNATSRESYESSERKLKSYINERKRTLATSIANNRVYSHAKVDILNVTESLADACVLARADKKSLETVNFLEDYIRECAKGTDDSERKKRLDNLANFLGSWSQTNLLGNVSGDFNLVKTAMTKKVAKTYSKIDNEMMRFLKDEVKNIDDKDDFQFQSEGVTYKKTSDSFYKKISNSENLREEDTEIGIEEFEKAYEKYLNDTIEQHLGKEVTVGSGVMGMVGVKAISSLALNVASGVINRIVGSNINRAFAASGRFGFNEKDLANSRKLMSMSNLDRYLKEGIGLPAGTRGKKIAEDIRTLKLFATSFDLIQLKINEIDGISDSFSKEGFSVMDWAVNFPEFRNQGEIILSILQNQYLEYQDASGNTIQVPIFDGETQEWVYKPGTLILKDEYRTEENVRIWENFATSKDGNNPHLAALFNMQAVIERSQGNYNKRDKPKMMGSNLGQALIMFKRYIPEQMFNQYGKIDQDIILGQENYEGRTRVLLKYAPATATVLTAIGFSVYGGLGAMIALPVGIAASSFFKFYLKRTQQELEVEALSALDQAKMSASILAELCMRVIDRPIESVSRGRNRKLYQVNDLSSKVDEKLNFVMKEQDRKILSESVQDAANSVYTAGMTVALVLAVRFIGEILTEADDDDDEETYKKKMETFEGISNLLVNRYGMLTSDIVRNFNPNVFLDDIQPVLAGNIEATRRMLVKGHAAFKEEEDWAPVLHNWQRSVFNPIPIPNQLSDTFLKPGSSFITNPKIWDKPWWYPEANTIEGNADKAIKFQRGKIKEEMIDAYKEHFLEELKQRSKEEQEDFATNKYTRNKMIEKYAEDAVKKQMGKMYRKKNGEASTDYYNRVDFKKEREEWKEGEKKLDFTLRDMEAGKGYKDKGTKKRRTRIYY